MRKDETMTLDMRSSVSSSEIGEKKQLGKDMRNY